MATLDPQKAAWEADIWASVAMYNNWFMTAAPAAFKRARNREAASVREVFAKTIDMAVITPQLLIAEPWMLSVLRMATCPPIAVDRLIGLAGIQDSLVDRMTKKGDLPPNSRPEALIAPLERICSILNELLDYDLFPWIATKLPPQQADLDRAIAVVTDRLSGSMANPEIRNAQEDRQLRAIGQWLDARQYNNVSSSHSCKFDTMRAGTYAFRLNVPVEKGIKKVQIPVDIVVMPMSAKEGEFPLLIEAKSAGDFTNVNKRRKEEAQKAAQLRQSYPSKNVRFHLLLCGYFDVGYLEYEQASQIGWTWEHRLDDLATLGL